MIIFQILMACVFGFVAGCVNGFLDISTTQNRFMEIDHNMESFRIELAVALKEINEKHYAAMQESKADNE